jgi:hypothetical protein
MKFILPIVTICFLSIQTFAQNGDFNLNLPVIPLSPEVTALSKHNIIPVGLFTGIPSVSIPVAEAKGKKLSQNITLSYHASGIKVEEVASNVGLGWSLSASGMIARQVRGIADDISGIGYLHSSTKPSQFIAMPEGLPQMYLAKDVIDNNLDLEPDIYSFSFDGYSGEFFFDESGILHFKSAIDLKVDVEMGDLGEIEGWKVITPNGNLYFFGKSENGLRSAVENTLPSRDQLNLPDYTSAWWLIEKIDYGSRERMEYFYAQRLTVTDIRSMERKGWFYNCVNPPNSYTPISFTRSINRNLRIDSIASTFNSIKFFYKKNREDVPSAQSLDSVTVYNELGERLKSTRFTYSYFLSDAQNLPYAPANIDERTKRLKLLSVQEFYSDENPIPPYTFSYNSESLPERFSFAIDYWGYFNGANNSTLIPSFEHYGPTNNYISFPGADRVPNAIKAQASILNRINYPSGGSVEFEYEGNSMTPDGKLDIFKKHTPKSVTIHDFGNDNQQELFTIANNTTIGGAFVQYRFFNPPNCDPNTRQCGLFFKIDRLSIPTTSTTYYSFEGQVFLPNGDYRITVRRIDYNDNFGLFDLLWKEVLPEDQNVVQIGGLRVKRVIQRDGGVIVKEVSYEYSGGFLTSSPLIAYSELNDVCRWSQCASFIITSISNYPMATSQGGYVGYSQVKEIQGANGEGGYSKNIFSHSYDDDYDAREFPFPPPDTFDHRRGRLLHKLDYSASNRLLKRIDYTYSDEFASFAPRRVSVSGIKVGSMSLAPSTPAACWKLYTTSGEWSHLDRVEESLFNAITPDSLVTKTEYFYDEPTINLEATSIKTASSSGSISETIRNFPTTHPSKFNYQLTQGDVNVKNKLVVDNSIKNYLEEFQTTTTLGSTNSLQRVFNKYGISIEGKTQLKQLFTAFGTNGYELKASYDAYDQNNNLLQYTTNSGIVESIIWTKDMRHIIAKTTGASTTETFHTSFEDGLGTIGQSKTGGKYHNGASYTIPLVERPTGVNLQMTFWYFDGAWKFQTEIPYTPTIAIAGATRYDEVRVFPKGAQMTTYTYKLGVGVSSVTDTNNKTSYFEYDNLARLISTKDSYGNILKTYSYNYKQ